MSSVGTGAVIFGCEGPRLTAREQAFFRDCDPMGFILFARNVETPDQVYRLTCDLRETVGRAAPILIDQEGGRVQRLRAPHWREWDPPLDMVSRLRPDDAARAMWIRARLIAEELHRIGIDANCAPCADIAGVATHPFLRNRCYGTDAATVATLSRSTANGLLHGGVLPVIKHLPGHGRATADTHHDLPTVTADLAELTVTDFAPFHAMNDLPMAMTAHIVFADIDPEFPATQSPAAIRVIRERIGFGGLLMTDDLNMQALSGNLAERTLRAIAAGCDLALHCKGDMDEMMMVATAAGRMSSATIARAEAALARRLPPEPIDSAALEAELSSLLHGKPHV